MEGQSKQLPQFLTQNQVKDKKQIEFNNSKKLLDMQIRLLCFSTAVEICRNETVYKVDHEKKESYCYRLIGDMIEDVYKGLLTSFYLPCAD